MPTVDEPTIWDRTLYRGTDHAWILRRVTGEGEPIIPQSAKAQIRESFGSALWIECEIEIDNVDGWVTVRIPVESCDGPEWGSRVKGVWDIQVTVDGNVYRWAMGTVKISQDVTR